MATTSVNRNTVKVSTQENFELITAMNRVEEIVLLDRNHWKSKTKPWPGGEG